MSFCILYNFYDRIEFIAWVFPIYTSHAGFETIVHLLLQSIICVNCCRPTLLLRKCWAPSLLSSSSSRTESPYFAGQTYSSGFISVNFKSRLSGTKSLSSSVHHAEILCLAGLTSSSGFLPVNPRLHLSETESLSPLVHYKKTGIKGKTAANEATTDEDYDPLV